MMAFCPFIQDECREDCVLYRQGMVRFADGRTESYNGCALNIGVSCLEGLLRRMTAVQRVAEETRNAVLRGPSYGRMGR